MTRPTKHKSIAAEYTNVMTVPNFDCILPPMIAPSDCPKPPYMAFKNINCDTNTQELVSDSQSKEKKCCPMKTFVRYLPW